MREGTKGDQRVIYNVLRRVRLHDGGRWKQGVRWQFTESVRKMYVYCI